MTVVEAFTNAIQLLNIESGDNSPVYIRERVIADLNAALQTMATGLDYFNREPITLEVSVATPTSDFPADTLHVFGPVRLGNGAPLSEIKTRGEFDQFAQVYLGYLSSAPSGQPVGYFVEQLNRAGDPNSAKSVLRVTPLPSETHDVELEISRLPETFAVADLSDPSPDIPVPQNFAESILLPILRWNVRTSHFFDYPEMLPSMEAEFIAAMTQLGLATPQTDKGLTLPGVLERKKAAARAAARQAYQEAQ